MGAPTTAPPRAYAGAELTLAQFDLLVAVYEATDGDQRPSGTERVARLVEGRARADVADALHQLWDRGYVAGPEAGPGDAAHLGPVKSWSLSAEGRAALRGIGYLR